MRTSVVAGFVAMILVGAGRADEAPKAPQPTKEHEWLKQLEGEWATEAESAAVPGMPAMKLKGTESVKGLGGFWSVSESKVDYMGTPVNAVMTLGYDTQKKKFVGTWLCSMCDSLCTYEGTLAGNTLTLDTEGPNPATGKVSKMRDVIEVKDKDHKVLTSWMPGPDGKWVQFMTIKFTRKK
ncbi:MAG TPA: DUF1579 domain-containing protein [Gemmataceae bacterium]|jgi:hypothetical protein|nr:DUF1579 domain-containing protein [Gemmataceae bacterium]